MQKAKKYNIAETNLANFGTDIEKKVKEASAAGEKAWAETGKSVGLLIWRIEKFKVVKSKTPPGVFYENDSYIVLNTYKKENKLLYDVHFWLGRTTTQDEAGTAAYKTVELDTYLKGLPVQHREVQDHESELFLSYFKDKGGIRILEGGVESGFNHVKPTEYKPKLLWLKGKKYIRVTEVEKSYKSLNSGDVFILDAGLTIYQWNGKKSGAAEKGRAAQLTRAIDDSRNGKPEVVVMEEGSEEEAFWKLLGGKGEVAGAEAGGKDEDWENHSKKVLFKFSDESGSLKFEKIAEDANVKKSLLKSEDGFVYDAGNHVWVWLGKGASVNEKKYAMKYAQEYLRETNRPNFLPISLINEGAESAAFNKAF
jgi:gelsolin